MNIKGAVACGHTESTQAAQQVLMDGGNAFDAALAAYFMACMAEPVLASLGGGGFLVAQSESQSPFAVDFFVQTPLCKKQLPDLDFEEIVVDFGSTTQSFHMGYGSIAVPGCIRGMFELHRRFCRMPMADLMAPAINAAKQGVTITAEQAAILSLVKPIYVNRASARDLFIKPGSNDVLKHGETYVNADLAQVLEILAIEGEDLFYRGEIAQQIEQAATSHGGSITAEDLNSYQVQWRDPLQGRFNTARVYLNPPPSAGGMLVKFALDLMAVASESSLSDRDTAYFHRLASAVELTQQARIEALAKSPYQELEHKNLFDPRLLKKYSRDIADRHKCNRGTTHISVADRWGNIVAMTVSNGEGCGEILPGTGIMLNNMLGEDDLNPLGLNQWSPDRRLSSMMCPGIAVTDAGAMALGSGGSNRIRTAVLQVLINHILCKLPVEISINAARMHYDDKLYLEISGIDQSVINSLKKQYPDMVLFPDRDFYFGGVNAVAMGVNEFQAVSDQRRGGRAVIVN